MESPNKNKRFPLLGLAALLLLFITMAPVAAQAPVQIALLSVTVSRYRQRQLEFCAWDITIRAWLLRGVQGAPRRMGSQRHKPVPGPRL